MLERIVNVGEKKTHPSQSIFVESVVAQCYQLNLHETLWVYMNLLTKRAKYTHVKFVSITKVKQNYTSISF